MRLSSSSSEVWGNDDEVFKLDVVVLAISTFGRLRQEDHELKARMGYLGYSASKTNKQK
jgi:hypothetical protein